MATTNLKIKRYSGSVRVDEGDGTPNHVAPINTEYVDNSTRLWYINTTGLFDGWRNKHDDKLDKDFSLLVSTDAPLVSDTLALFDGVTNSSTTLLSLLSSSRGYLKIKNVESTTINYGDFVVPVGYEENTQSIRVVVADNTVDFKLCVLGCVFSASIAASGYGVVTTRGIVSSLNTSVGTQGDLIYLSTNGGFTNTKPTTNVVVLGSYVVADVVNGEININIESPDFFSQGKPILRGFSNNIYFDVADSYSSNINQTTGISFTAADVSFGYGSTYFVTIVANGSSISFSGDFVVLRNDYSTSTIGTYDFMFFLGADGLVRVSIIRLAVGLSPLNYNYNLIGDGYIIQTFNSGLWGDPTQTSPVDISDFALTFTTQSGATGANIVSITNESGGVLVGGESILKISYTYTGTPDGTEIMHVNAANDNSVFDGDGLYLSSSKTSDNIYVVKSGTLQDVTVNTSLNLTANGTVYTSTTSSAFGGRFLANESLSTSGYIMCDIDAFATDEPFLMFTPTNTLGVWQDAVVGMTCVPHIYHNTLGVGVDTGFDVIDNSKVRQRRSSDITILEYAENGVDFRHIYTSSYISTDIYYIMFSAYHLAATITNPKILQ